MLPKNGQLLRPALGVVWASKSISGLLLTEICYAQRTVLLAYKLLILAKGTLVRLQFNVQQ